MKQCSVEGYLKNHYKVYLAVIQIVSWHGIQSSVEGQVGTIVEVVDIA